MLRVHAFGHATGALDTLARDATELKDSVVSLWGEPSGQLRDVRRMDTGYMQVGTCNIRTRTRQLHQIMLMPRDGKLGLVGGLGPDQAKHYILHHRMIAARGLNG